MIDENVSKTYIDLPEPPDSQDKPRPVPHPRVPTVEKQISDATDPTPYLAPKFSNPQFPSEFRSQELPIIMS